MSDIFAVADNPQASWEEKFLFIARKCPLMVEAYDENYNYIFWNEAAQKMTGYSAEEIIGNPYAFDLLYPEPEQRDRITRCCYTRGYDFKPYDWILTTKSGEKRKITTVNVSRLVRPLPSWYFWNIAVDRTAEMQAARDVEQHKQELLNQVARSNDLNAALNVLMERQKEEAKNIRDDFVRNQDELVLPFLEKLRSTRLDTHQAALLEIALGNIHKNTSQMGNFMSDLRRRLSIAEFEVASLIGQGKSTLEVADILNLAPYTISTHRNNIRRKLDLVGKKTNLTVFLRSAFAQT